MDMKVMLDVTWPDGRKVKLGTFTYREAQRTADALRTTGATVKMDCVCELCEDVK